MAADHRAGRATYRPAHSFKVTQSPQSSKIVGTTRAIILFQPPRYVCAYQFRHRGVPALGDGLQHLSVIVIEPDDLVVPMFFGETVLLPPISSGAYAIHGFARLVNRPVAKQIEKFVQGHLRVVLLRAFQLLFEASVAKHRRIGNRLPVYINEGSD
jgi:hypothetical protein